MLRLLLEGVGRPEYCGKEKKSFHEQDLIFNVRSAFRRFLFFFVSACIVSPLQLLQHLASRPLGQCKLRTLPLYTEGRWRHFLLLRLRQQQVLVFSAPLRPRTALSRLSDALLLWAEEECSELSLSLSLPGEEPPVLLRHYTGQETVAFLYCHHNTGVTVAPPPRNAHAHGALVASAAMHSHAQHPGATQAASAARLAEQANKAEVAKTLQVFSWFYSRAK